VLIFKKQSQNQMNLKQSAYLNHPFNLFFNDWVVRKGCDFMRFCLWVLSDVKYCVFEVLKWRCFEEIQKILFVREYSR